LLNAVIPWLKALHFTSLMIWSACLIAMPALFAAHRAIVGTEDAVSARAASRFMYIAIASPAAIVAIASGAALIHPTNAYAGWMPLKLTLVALMTAHHLLCGRSVIALHDHPSAWPARHPVILALAPTPLIIGVLYLVLAKPF
jgi:protoporphyrinogen IX oxidase